MLHGGTQDNGSLRYLGHPVWHASALGDAFGTAIDPHDPRRWYALYVYDDPVDPGGGVTLVQRSKSGGSRNSYDYAVKGLDDSDGPMVEERYVPIVPDPLRANVIYLATVRVYPIASPTLILTTHRFTRGAAATKILLAGRG